MLREVDREAPILVSDGKSYQVSFQKILDGDMV